MLVNDRLQWRLKVSKILPQNMTCLRRHRITMNNILDLVTHIKHEITLGNLTIAVFLDIRRAFHTVSHAHVL